MHGRRQGHIGADHHVVTDVHWTYIQTGEIEIGPAEFAEGGIAAVIKVDRSLQRWQIGRIGQELPQDRGSLFRLILVRLIVFSRQFPGFDQQERAYVPCDQYPCRHHPVGRDTEQ